MANSLHHPAPAATCVQLLAAGVISDSLYFCIGDGHPRLRSGHLRYNDSKGGGKEEVVEVDTSSSSDVGFLVLGDANFTIPANSTTVISRLTTNKWGQAVVPWMGLLMGHNTYDILVHAICTCIMQMILFEMEYTLYYVILCYICVDVMQCYCSRFDVQASTGRNPTVN